MSSEHSLDVDLVSTAPTPCLQLRGRIDETATLAEWVAKVSGRVAIDLEHVQHVNTLGLREWINFLGALKARGISVALRNCSEVMVAQMNMVLDARMGAEIESFLAPYLCPECDVEESICIKVKDHLQALRAGKPPREGCPECGARMDFDGLPEQDFLFLH